VNSAIRFNFREMIKPKPPAFTGISSFQSREEENILGKIFDSYDQHNSKSPMFH